MPAERGEKKDIPHMSSGKNGALEIDNNAKKKGQLKKN